LSATFVLNEVIGVERSGVPLRIFSTKDPDGEPVHPRVAQVAAPVTYLSLHRHWKAALQANLRLLCRQPGRYCSTLLHALRFRRRVVLRSFFQAGYLAQELWRGSVAHLHAHFAHAPALVAMFAHQLTGISYTFTAHAKDIYVDTPPELLRAEARGALAVITCTEYNRRYLSSQIGPAVNGKLHCVYHGLDLSQFSFPWPRLPDPGPPIILSVARLVEKKGLRDLIVAADILRRRGRSFRVEILGDGPLRQTLEALVGQLGLSERVQLLGTQTHDRVRLAYQRASIFALPCVITPDGDRDGIPNVLLEAMGSGIPVVSTPVSGIPELIESERDGLLVPPHNPPMLAGALERLLAEPEARERLARAARAKIEARFALDRSAILLLALFQPGGVRTAPALRFGDGPGACRGAKRGRKRTVNVADALSWCAKLEGIRWLLRGGPPRRALRRALSALLPATEMLGPCRLRYARVGPGRKLTGYYDALIHIEGTEGYRARPVAVTWRSDGDADPEHGTAELAEIQAAAARHGVAAPFRQLGADVPAWGMHLQVFPLDARIPQLVRLSDPRYVRDVVAGAYAARAAAVDQALSRGYDVTSIRYRPGKRHVLRYDSLDTTERETIFAKVYHSEKGGQVFRVATQVADWLAQGGDLMTTVRPLAYVAEDAVVLYPRVSGAPFYERLLRPDRGVARWLRRAGAALRALHHLPPAAAGPLRILDFAAEIREIERETAHVPALLPPVGATIRALLDRAQELHARLPQEPPTFTHRDFKCEHLLVAPRSLTLIDFDRCAFADPAFDLGKLLADLHWWFTAYDQEGLEEAQAQFLGGYVPDKERLVRARLYEAVELAHMTVLRARLFERHAAGRIEGLIGRAQTVVGRLQLTLGAPGSVVNREEPARTGRGR